MLAIAQEPNHCEMCWRCQSGAARAGARTDELGRTHPRIRSQAHRRGQEQEGDLAVPEAVRGPRGLPDPHGSRELTSFHFGALTDIGASLTSTVLQEVLLNMPLRVILECEARSSTQRNLRLASTLDPSGRSSTAHSSERAGRGHSVVAVGV